MDLLHFNCGVKKRSLVLTGVLLSQFVHTRLTECTNTCHIKTISTYQTTGHSSLSQHIKHIPIQPNSSQRSKKHVKTEVVERNPLDRQKCWDPYSL